MRLVVEAGKIQAKQGGCENTGHGFCCQALAATLYTQQHDALRGIQVRLCFLTQEDAASQVQPVLELFLSAEVGKFCGVILEVKDTILIKQIELGLHTPRQVALAYGTVIENGILCQPAYMVGRQTLEITDKLVDQFLAGVDPLAILATPVKGNFVDDILYRGSIGNGSADVAREMLNFWRKG